MNLLVSDIYYKWEYIFITYTLFFKLYFILTSQVVLVAGKMNVLYPREYFWNTLSLYTEPFLFNFLKSVFTFSLQGTVVCLFTNGSMATDATMDANLENLKKYLGSELLEALRSLRPASTLSYPL